MADPVGPVARPRWVGAVLGPLFVVSLAALMVIPSPRAKAYPAFLEVGCKQGSIIAFGDSITFGLYSPPADAYPVQLAKLTGEPVCNAGILGDTAQAALLRLNRDVLEFHPRAVLVAFGTNDSGMLTKPVPLNEFRADLEAIAGTVMSHGAAVVFLSLPPVNVPLVESHDLNPSRHAEYDDAIRSVAREMHAPLVDLTAAFAGDLTLLHDGVHPTAAGYLVIARAVAKVLAGRATGTGQTATGSAAGG